MSVVRFFLPENRLGQAIKAAGGKKIDAAIADAEEQIQLAADECAGKIDETLEFVYRVAADRPSSHLDTIYMGVREVAGLASIAELPDLGSAALIFCSLLDLGQQAGRLSDEQIQVNLGVMRLLRRPERFTGPERRELLANLQAVLEKAHRDAAAA